MINIAVRIHKAPVQDHEIHEVFRVITAGINSDYEVGDLIVNGDADFGNWMMTVSDRPLQIVEHRAPEIKIQIDLSDDALETDRDVENIMALVRKGVDSGASGGEIALRGSFLGEWEISYKK